MQILACYLLMSCGAGSIGRCDGSRVFVPDFEGSLMWLNGEKVVDNNGCHGETERSSTKKKYKAGSHPLVVDMCELGGGEAGAPGTIFATCAYEAHCQIIWNLNYVQFVEVLKMRYKGPDTGNSKKTVPKSALRLPVQKRLIRGSLIFVSLPGSLGRMFVISVLCSAVLFVEAVLCA